MRDDFAEQGLAEFIKVTVGNGTIAKRAGIRLENFWFTVAERHDDEHGLGFASGNEIVEYDVGAAHLGPGVIVVTVAVQQIENGISLLATRVVAGRSVHEEAAIVADHL